MAKAKVLFEMDHSGVGALLKSEKMANALHGKAMEISARCGSGYAADTKRMPTRVIASVYTDTAEAMRDNMENNTIMKAVGGGA